jgi:DNA-binding transcriptional ArsR family regulator
VYATLNAESAVEVTQTLTQNLPFNLSVTALKLFRALHTAAVEVMKARGYHPKTSQVSFFCPAESVALAIGVHPSTVYRKLSELRQHGLVDCRGHFCTYRGKTRSDGSVWAVKMNPSRGCKAKVPYDMLKKQYRNLGADIEAGRTAWASLRESKSLEAKQGLGISQILSWALPRQTENPVTYDSRKGTRLDLEAVLDVPFVPKGERNQMVDLAANSMASALNDHGSTNFYCYLIWNLLRLSDKQQGDYFQQVYQMAVRARVDRQEGFARRAGALFCSRLKQAPWYERLRALPAYRVGMAPPKN